MTDDLVKRLRLGACALEIEQAADRIEELEAKLELIQEEWAGAVYGDLENGVASLNAAAATDFCKRYPLVYSFGETLNRIIDGDTP